ncbi:hypothetical protein [Alteribacter aurantiacus]|uniref:hypothetical protein n=1 Tax=Alteribacter aurantiacus TaxID=254410 RepID=UPI0012ECA536|nr:hypothetical protein [Alteribacter aurantiacus]
MMLNKWYVMLDAKLNQAKETVKEERGALSLEWVALGLLVIVFISGIIAFLDGDDTMGSAIVERLADFINQLGG